MHRFVWGLLAGSACALAQEYAVLSGQIIDLKEAAVPGAGVTLTHLRRGSQQTATTTETGGYSFSSIEPGDYSLLVQKKGFADLKVETITLKSRDRQSLKLTLQIAATTSSITVEARAEGISADSSGGAEIEQDFLRHLPVNGRTIDALLQLSPGVVSNGAGINVNGLRSNTNYYMLDGVSLSQGAAGGGPGGGAVLAPRGSGIAPVAGGNSLDTISLDALQEVRIQTSAFAPEFGRTPGAQVSMSSRGGANEFHGSAYEYFRNDRLNANDWFANRNGLARGRMQENQFGATLGGRIVPNRTFFFISGEVLRLRAPETTVSSVPDLATRRTARANLRPYLHAFPLPNGPIQDNGAAQLTAVFTNPLDRESWSARIDHTINHRNSLFVRASLSPSGSVQRGSDFVTPNTVNTLSSRAETLTVSLVSIVAPASTNDLRVNVSRNASRRASYMDNFGGATPLTDAQVFPNGITSETGNFSMSILGLTSYTYSSHSRNEQTQVNVVDGLTMIAGSHAYKFGVDLRTSAASNYSVPYSLNAVFNGLSGEDQAFLTGTSANTVVSSSVPSVHPNTLNWSLYFQDTFRANERTTITLGLRWDVNPAPGTWKGPRPLAIASSNEERVTQSDPLYNTRWTDIAPRFGLSHQITNEQGKEWVLRLGVGLFHDLGYGTSLSAFSGAPYTNARTLTLASFPLAASDLAPPALPASKPYNQLGAAERTLRSPRVVQANLALERSIGLGQVVSVGYVGTRGRQLLRTETSAAFSDDYDVLRLATNGAESDYHSLQAQWRRRFAANFTMQAAYTYGHSIDSASNDLGFGGGFATLFANERGSSDFDVRHSLNISGSWRMPEPKLPVLKQAFGGWWSDFMIAWRTSTPFDVVGLTDESSNSSATTTTGRGLFAQVRPDYNGLPVWVDDPTAPGGRRLNRDAFEAPSGFGQGNLARNALRGYGLSQADWSLRRQVNIGERRALHLSVQAFNIFNQVNFANPSRNEGANLASPSFGVPNRTQQQGIAGGSLGSVYRAGGPRSVQLSARFQF